MKRNLRRSIDIGLTITGVIIIFGSILYGAYISLEQQLMQVIVGVMLMEAGVWRLSNKILHTDRSYTDLREEGDYIIKLIRELNAAALVRDKGEEDDGQFQIVLEEMHSSVERMSELAGRSNETKL